jgi:hypothetical protein
MTPAQDVLSVSMLLALLAGCGPALPASPPAATGCADEAAEACREQRAAALCAARGGRWVQFHDGCQDLCAYRAALAAEQTPTCTMDTPMGCDCGPDGCWTGTECAPEPPANPPPALPSGAPPAACRPAPETERTESLGALTARGRCLADWALDLTKEVAALGDHPRVHEAVSCLDPLAATMQALVRGLEAGQDGVDEAARATDTVPRERTDVELRAFGSRLDRLAAEVGGCL